LVEITQGRGYSLHSTREGRDGLRNVTLPAMGGGRFGWVRDAEWVRRYWRLSQSVSCRGTAVIVTVCCSHTKARTASPTRPALPCHLTHRPSSLLPACIQPPSHLRKQTTVHTHMQSLTQLALTQSSANPHFTSHTQSSPVQSSVRTHHQPTHKLANTVVPGPTARVDPQL
jgi:hypothetical protein